MYFKTSTAVNGILQSDFYTSRKQAHRKLLMDKCNFVLHRIIEGNVHNWEVKDFEPVEISATILQGQLGRDYRKILNLLIDSNIIETNRKYITAKKAAEINLSKGKEVLKAHCIKYGLTKEAKKGSIIKVGMGKRMAKKLSQLKEGQIKILIQNKAIYAKIIRSLCDIYFKEDISDIKPVKKREEQSYEALLNHYAGCTRTALRMNKAEKIQDFIDISGFYISASKKVGRVFHTLASMPKEFRRSLIHRTGEDLSIIDLKSAQPILLFSKWVRDSQQVHNIYNKNIDLKKEEEEKGKEEGEGICCAVMKEQQEIKKALFSGTFYGQIVERCKESYPELYELYLTNYDGYKGFKWLIFARGFYNRLMPLNKAHRMEQVLYDLYPNWMEYIREEKKKYGYKTVSIEAQKAESNLFIYGLFPYLSDSDFCIPIHDAVIVKKMDSDFYANMLSTLFGMQHQHLGIDSETIYRLFIQKPLGV